MNRRSIPALPPYGPSSIRAAFSLLWHARFLAQDDQLFADAERRLHAELVSRSRAYGLGAVLDVPRVHFTDLSPKTFGAIYRNCPVVVEGLLDKSPAVRTWSLDALAARFPHTIVPCANQHADSDLPYEDLTFSTFVEELRHSPEKPRYLMASSTLFDAHRELLDELELSRLVDTFGKTIIRAELFIGTGQNGSPYHCASSGNLFCNVHGQKDWLLVSPQHSMWMYPQIGRNGLAVYVNSPVLSDQPEEICSRFPLYQYVPKLRASLRPGDVLYVPPWWWHEVTNRGECIGVPVRLLDNGGGNSVFSSFQLTMGLVAPEAARRLLPVARQVFSRVLQGRADLSSLYLSDDLTRASHVSSRLYDRGWRRHLVASTAGSGRTESGIGTSIEISA